MGIWTSVLLHYIHCLFDRIFSASDIQAGNGIFNGSIIVSLRSTVRGCGDHHDGNIVDWRQISAAGTNYCLQCHVGVDRAAFDGQFLLIPM